MPNRSRIHQLRRRIRLNRLKRKQRYESERIFIIILLLKLNDTDSKQSEEYLDQIHIRDRRIPRDSLISPTNSPWERIYENGTDQAFITLLGFDRQSFDALVENFTPYYNTMTPHRNKQDSTAKCLRTIPDRTKHRSMVGGRPRTIDEKTCVALALSFYRFKGPLFILQGWFGLTGSIISMWLRYTIILLINIIRSDNKYAILFPDDNQVQLYQEMISRKYPILQGVFCVADGLKLAIEKSGDKDIQTSFFNGWTHGHYISNLFVFGADGKIIFCVTNAPGSVHDSTLAHIGGLYEMLADVHNRVGGKCCMDSAFAARNNPGIIRSSERDRLGNDEYDVLINRAAISLRQAAEWGMHAIQSAFPRLTNKFQYEENGLRGLILELMPLLYNYRLYNVGLNQIKTVYASYLEHDAESVFI